MTTDTVTVIPLSALAGACETELAIVRREWPDGIPLTEKTAERAVELGLDIDYAAKRLLTAPALAEYERVTDQALSEYRRVTDQAFAEYDRLTASAWAEYERLTDSAAEAEYERVAAPARAEYQRATASVLLNLLLQQDTPAARGT